VIFCSKLNSELTFPKSICSSWWLLPWWRTWYPKKKISQWSELQWFSLINSVTSWLLRKLFILNTKYMGFSPSSKKRKKITKNYFLNQEAGATMENRAHGTCQHPWGKNKRISASKSLSRHGWQHSCRPLHNKNKNGITFYHDMTHPWKKKIVYLTRGAWAAMEDKVHRLVTLFTTELLRDVLLWVVEDLGLQVHVACIRYFSKVSLRLSLLWKSTVELSFENFWELWRIWGCRSALPAISQTPACHWVYCRKSL